MPYHKTIWNNGASPGISADRLNNMEEGIESAHLVIDQLKNTVSNLETRTKTLEDSLLNDFKNNIFFVNFKEIQKVKVSSGWYDKGNKRLVIL
ncbi:MULTISPECIES: hypothetical protein [Brevibacillus]|uniref:Uncharacterized protein n=1 Tax=Brevibacillus halotolerans TaxID=1507437 RepID=A0ABT4HY77_9BACL|nr:MULTISPECIES: hypothetical protein [Brevibacillus]MCR8986010.1 hypothetical protein [Brevibacillus laterosporus]MCZ0831743.1 hypothetical protein [Brevibacillus halotolerans]